MNELFKIVTITAILLCLSSALAWSQISFERSTTDEIVDFILTEHKRITKEVVELTDVEAKDFWPTYDAYQNALRNVIPKFVAFTKLLIQTRNESVALSDERADAIINNIITAKLELLKLQKSYVKKFRKVLPPQKVLLLVEVDEGIVMAFRLKRMSEMPLIK